jgi:hypothetical protein
MKQDFHVIVERRKDGTLTGRVAELEDCCCVSKSLDDLIGKSRKAIVRRVRQGVMKRDFVGIHIVGIADRKN